MPGMEAIGIFYAKTNILLIYILYYDMILTGIDISTYIFYEFYFIL